GLADTRHSSSFVPVHFFALNWRWNFYFWTSDNFRRRGARRGQGRRSGLIPRLLALFYPCEETFVELIVKSTHGPKESRDVAIVAQQDLLVANAFPELLMEFFFGVERDELRLFRALIGIARTTTRASQHTSPQHFGQLTVVRTGAQVPLEPAAAVAVNHLPAVCRYFLEGLEFQSQLNLPSSVPAHRFLLILDKQNRRRKPTWVRG